MLPSMTFAYVPKEHIVVEAKHVWVGDVALQQIVGRYGSVEFRHFSLDRFHIQRTFDRANKGDDDGRQHKFNELEQ